MKSVNQKTEPLSINKITSKSPLPPNALESDFPAIEISRLAEVESWRKEVHRPATHTHKWWAKRLGTVFRGIIIAAASKDGKDAVTKMHEPVALPNLTLFDPFAGSGTTLVESVKLGLRTIGKDINPVATLVQRQALASWNSEELSRAFSVIENKCKEKIAKYYQTQAGDTVLYYFWVAVARCPDCEQDVELFSNKIFAKHAYPKKYPESKAYCTECGDIVSLNYADDSFVCKNGHRSSSKGPVNGQVMTCRNGHVNKVLSSLKGTKPDYKMYAKLVLSENGTKTYQPITAYDRKLYSEAKKEYQEIKDRLIVPTGALEDGINTRQAKSWGFDTWEKFFNTRQLLTLGLLARAISDLDADERTREAMATLFSGTLEFNNLFCSYKGEGTGAVRHMFSHHILKPERVPLEANPWGTKFSSGSFSTLFKSRILRAHDYKNNPSDLVITDDKVQKTTGISNALNTAIAEDWKDFSKDMSSAYIVSGDSGKTDIPDKSVDLVITDPPYMDNVHYSELADFFHAWLKHITPYRSYNLSETTRSVDEVQSAKPEDFSLAIERVWRESARVLKDDGLVAFTFHQARITGWIALVTALRNAGLVVTAIQPIKGEMSTSVTKAGAANPSNLDSIVVCRKVGNNFTPHVSVEDSVEMAVQRLEKLASAGIKVGITDVSSVVKGTVLSCLTYPSQSLSIKELEELADKYAVSASVQLGLA